MMDDHTPRPPRRLRFSLRSLFAATTIAALAITVTMLWREVGPLRAEVRKLREEMGALTVEDETQFCAIQCPKKRYEHVWRWRIWLPAGQQYAVKGAFGLIPTEGFPQSEGSMNLGKPGEHVVEYRIELNRDGRWVDQVNCDGGGFGSNQQDWVESYKVTSFSGVSSRKTHESSADKPFILSRFRVSDSESSADIPDPAPGFMIWIEPLGPTAAGSAVGGSVPGRVK